MSGAGAGDGARRITLLTDFGTRDGYVAAMRGVIASIAPRVHVEDASHDVPAGDVQAGAWALANYWRHYPEGTVHVAVVDPGVGSDRRALAIEADGRLAVAPDNGLLTFMLARAGRLRAVRIENPQYMRDVIAPTFHGRDIFAPVAAHLSGGVPLEALGSVVEDPVLLPIVEAIRRPGVIRGRVVHVDNFGNLITNVPGEWITAQSRVRFGATDLGVVRATYSDAQVGHAVAIIGSAGYLEVAVRDGNAATVLWKGRGTEVLVEG